MRESMSEEVTGALETLSGREGLSWRCILV